MVRNRKPMEKRFWAKVVKTETCWLWQGHLGKDGYGDIAKGGKRGKGMRAHRYSYELHNGPVPDGLFVLHSCDVPSCVNPKHLFLGTIADNNLDCCQKGRNARGVKCGNHNLDEDQVRLIRYIGKALTLQKIALLFNVHSSTIGRILTRKIWRHI